MKSRILRNWGLKLVSIVIAVGLFYFVTSQSNRGVFSFIIPVEVTNVPEEKILVWPLKLQAQVTVRGPSFLFTQISSSLPVFRVKIPADVENRYTANLKPSDLLLPPALEVVSIEPPEIEFTLDEVLEKSVPVLVPRIGSISKALKLGTFSLEPQRVSLKGPYSEVKGVRSVQSYPVDLRELKESTNLELPLRAPGKLTKLSHENVTVSIPVESLEQEREFLKVPIQIEGDPNLTVEALPAVVDITLIGPSKLMKRLKVADVKPYVVAGKDSLGKVRLRDLPERVRMIQITPDTVTISITGVEKPTPSVERLKKGEK